MQPAFAPLPAVDQLDAIVSGDQTERQFSERLLPFVKANAYTWVRLQSEKRKHRKDHNDRLSGEDERSLRAQIDDEPVDEKRRWATRLLVKLRKDIIAQDREHFVGSINGESTGFRCVRTNPDQKQKMRRIDCFRQADKVWRLDLVTTVLFRGFPLESTDGERLGRTCGNPLCIQPHHITVQVRELDLLLANFLVDDTHSRGMSIDTEAPPNLAINGAYTAEELRQSYSIPLSSLQGFHRPMPLSSSIPIGPFRMQRKRPPIDFGEMEEEMSDADSAALSSSVTSEHDMSSPKIPALMNVPPHIQQFIKTETNSSLLSTSFPPRWGNDCLLRGNAQPSSFAQSTSALSSSMTSPAASQAYPSFSQNANYSSSLPTSMQRHNPHPFAPDFSQLSLNTIQAGSPPAAGIVSTNWPGGKQPGRMFPAGLSTLSEPRFTPHAGHHPTTVSPEGMGQRSSSPLPAGLLSEEDAEDLISGRGAEEDIVPPGLYPLDLPVASALSSNHHHITSNPEQAAGLLGSPRWKYTV